MGRIITPMAAFLAGTFLFILGQVTCGSKPAVEETWGPFGPFAMRLDAADVVSVRLDKSVGYAPIDIRVWIRVEPHEGNRRLCVVESGLGKENLSCFPHTSKDLTQRSVLFRELPEGEYEFWAVLERVERVEGDGGVDGDRGPGGAGERSELRTYISSHATAHVSAAFGG